MKIHYDVIYELYLILGAIHKGRLSWGGQKVCSLHGRREDERKKTSRGGNERGLDPSKEMLQDVICKQPLIMIQTDKLFHFDQLSHKMSLKTAALLTIFFLIFCHSWKFAAL
jgi:hypothetical protein